MPNPTRLIDRMTSLRTRRTEIENRIRDEMASPAPNGVRLYTLDRLKMRAKDQIGMIRHQLNAPDGPNFPSAA